MTFLLVKASFKCALQSTHFLKLPSFYPPYQQVHLLAFLKKHLMPQPLSTSSILAIPACPARALPFSFSYYDLDICLLSQCL